MSQVHQAFRAPVGHSEKLVLTYLAHHANHYGFGIWDREQMEATLDYKRRSMQRIIKTLKDEGLLEDLGQWYHLKLRAGDVPAVVPGPPQGIEVEDLVTPLEPGKVLHVSAGLDDVVGQLQDDLLQSEARIRSDVNRVGFGVMGLKNQLAESLERADAPPPDPVLESAEYRAMLDLGILPELAYETAQKQLEAEDAPDLYGKGPITSEADIKPDPAEDMPRFTDDAGGRLAKIIYILTGDNPKEVSADLFERWQKLEDSENRYTIAGEIDAFEQLYPAIVDAARRSDGMTVEEFLDPAKIKANRAPWDMDPAPNAMEDPELEADIGRMLAVLNATGDKRLIVQPRNHDVAPDGTQLIETINAYHQRVKRMHQQMEHMQATGAI